MTARQPRAGGASAPAVGVFIGDPGTVSLARMEEWVRRAAMLQSRAEEAAQYASRTVAQGRHGYLASNLAASRRRILSDFSPEKWSEFQPWQNWDAEVQGEPGEVSSGTPTPRSAADPVHELYWQLYHQENAVEEVARLQKLLLQSDENGDAFACAFSSPSTPHSWREKLKQLVLDARQTLVEDFILLHHLYLHGEFSTYEQLLTDLATRLWKDSAWALTHRHAIRGIDTVWYLSPILPLSHGRGKGAAGGKRPRELSSSSSIEEDAEPAQQPGSATAPSATPAATAESDEQLSEEESSINELSMILREMMSEQFQHDHQELEGRARILSVLKKDGDIRTVLKLLRLSLYRAADTDTSTPSGSSEMKEGEAREALRKRLLAHGVAEILSQGRTALLHVDEVYSTQLQGSEVVAKKAPPSSSPGSPGPMSPSRRPQEEKTTPTRAEKQKPSPDTSPEKRRSIALRSEWQDRRREICEATAAQARVFIERYVAPAFFLSEQRRRGTVGSVLPPTFAELSPTTTTRSNTNSGGLKGGKPSHPTIAPPIVRLMDVIPIIDRGPGRPLTEANRPSSQLSTDLIQLARLIEEVERCKSSWEQPVEELRKKKNLIQGVIPIEVLRNALGRELNQHLLRVSRSSSSVTSSSPSPSSDLSSAAQSLTASFTDPTETPLEHLLRWIHSTESRAAQNFQFPSYTSALQQLSSVALPLGEGEAERTAEADAEAQVDIETAIAALEEEIAGEGTEDEEEEDDAGVVLEDDDDDEAVEEEVPVEEGTESVDEEAAVEEDEVDLEEEESDAADDAPALRARPEPARVDAQRHQRGRHRSSSQRSASEGDGGGVSSESAPPPTAGDLDAE